MDYVVLEIEFVDGIVWIMWLRMRDCKDSYTADALKVVRMDSEVATLQYLHKYTSIPVPNIISYSTSPKSNPLGADPPLFMIMMPIVGCKLCDVGIDLHIPSTYDGKQLKALQNFMMQLATIHLELSRVTFPTIGSLYNGPDGEGFIIGPCSHTGQGPFSTVMEYVDSCAKSFIHAAQSQPDDSEMEQKQRLFVTSTWQNVVHSLIDPHDNAGPFPLHHPDIHDENVIIDVDRNIISIFDWDAASTVPMEVFAMPSIQVTNFMPSSPSDPVEHTKHMIFNDALHTMEGFLSLPLPPSSRSYNELHDSLASYVIFFIACWMWSMKCDYDYVGWSLFIAIYPDADIDDVFKKWLQFHNDESAPNVQG